MNNEETNNQKLTKQSLLQNPIVRILVAALISSLLIQLIFAFFNQQIFYYASLFSGQILSGIFGAEEVGLAGLHVLGLILGIFSLGLDFVFALLIAKFIFSTRRVKYLILSFSAIVIINWALGFLDINEAVMRAVPYLKQGGALEKISETYARDPSDGIPHLKIHLELTNNESATLSGRVDAGSSYPHYEFYCNAFPEKISLEPDRSTELKLDCYTSGSGDVEVYREIYKSLPEQLEFQITIYPADKSDKGLSKHFFFKSDKRIWSDF